MFSKKIRNLLIFAIIISVIFIIVNLKIHPHFSNFKILESTAKHEGLIITRDIDCDKGECTKKIFRQQPRFVDVMKNFNKSAYGEIYSTSYNIWKDNILLGIGLNNFTTVCKNNSKYKKYHEEFGCTTHPHNLYLQALVESGVIGFVLFSTFVLLFFYKINSLALLEIKIIIWSVLLTIFWPIMSTGSLLKNWNMVFISFICACVLIVNEYFKKNYLR